MFRFNIFLFVRTFSCSAVNVPILKLSFILKEKDTWAKSLPFLIRNVDVPLVFTSYTKTEASKDLLAFTQAIKEHENQNAGSNKLITRTDQVKVEVEMQLNPFRSNRSIRDFEFDNNCDTFYSNQFMTVVRKIS